jgi:hypothetical protein
MWYNNVGGIMYTIKNVVHILMGLLVAIIAYVYVMLTFLVLALLGYSNVFAVVVSVYIAYRVFMMWRRSVRVG